MGHKVHPIGFRLGVIRDWQAKWYADKHFAEFLLEDMKLRQRIQSGYPSAGISQVEIKRQASEVFLTIYTSRPGIVIGRGGQRVDEMRASLEKTIGKRVRLNIMEVQHPELDATLVAKTVAEQIERRVSYRRAMKQAISYTLQAGAKGVRISVAGRLAGAEIARRLTLHEGRVPLHTLRADIDYGFTEAHTTMGRIGIKVWIYRGDILPETKAEEVEEAPAEAAVTTAEAVQPIAAVEPVIEAPAEPVVAKSKEAPAPVAEEKPKPRVRRAKAEAVAEPAVAESKEAPAEAAEKKTAKPRARKTKTEPPAEPGESGASQ